MNIKAGNTKSTLLAEAIETIMIIQQQAGEVHWLTQTNSSGEPSYSGLWRCEPMTFEYEFPGDETFQVLQGSLLIQLDDHDVNLQAGDIVSFNKGMKSTWTINSPFEKFFVIYNC